MSVTIAASSSTHFLWNGNPMPRVYRVVPHGALDARLESVDDRTWMLVPLGSAVSGSEPANRDALVAALAGIVSPAVGGGGGDVDPGAVGLAVNAAIRNGGALPVDTTQSIARPEYPPGTPIDFPIAITIATGTPYVVGLAGVTASPSLAVNPVGDAAINIEVQYASGGAWFPGVDGPITASSTADDKQHPGLPRCYAIRFTRSTGTNATSTVVLA